MKSPKGQWVKYKAEPFIMDVYFWVLHRSYGPDMHHAHRAECQDNSQSFTEGYYGVLFWQTRWVRNLFLSPVEIRYTDIQFAENSDICNPLTECESDHLLSPLIWCWCIDKGDQANSKYTERTFHFRWYWGFELCIWSKTIKHLSDVFTRQPVIHALGAFN